MITLYLIGTFPFEALYLIETNASRTVVQSPTQPLWSVENRMSVH